MSLEKFDEVFSLVEMYGLSLPASYPQRLQYPYPSSQEAPPAAQVAGQDCRKCRQREAITERLQIPDLMPNV